MLLQKFWVETHQKMIIALVKAKKEGKKLKALQQITTEMREAVLRRYFMKCKKKYSASFFEWRRRRRRVKVKHCVEILSNLRKKDRFIDETLRAKLLTQGIEGHAIIEEKWLKYYNYPSIESLKDLE